MGYVPDLNYSRDADLPEQCGTGVRGRAKEEGGWRMGSEWVPGSCRGPAHGHSQLQEGLAGGAPAGDCQHRVKFRCCGGREGRVLGDDQGLQNTGDRSKWPALTREAMPSAWRPVKGIRNCPSSTHSLRGVHGMHTPVTGVHPGLGLRKYLRRQEGWLKFSVQGRIISEVTQKQLKNVREGATGSSAVQRP